MILPLPCFDTRDLSASLETAGFTGLHVERVYEVVRDGATYPLFLATSTKIASPVT